MVLKGCLAHTESLAAGCADIPEITPRAAGMMGLKVGLQHISHMLGGWQLRMAPQLHPCTASSAPHLCCSLSCLHCTTVEAPYLHCRVCPASRLEVANTVVAQAEVEEAPVEAKPHGR